MAPRRGPLAQELTPDRQARLVAGLRQRLQAGTPDAEVALLETHISFVLVTPTHAFKIKKAVDLGFLDGTTLARRRRDCDEELRLNRRLAPDLYLGVLPITGTPEDPVLGGSGPAIEVAVQMRAFAQDGLWDRLAARDALGPAQIDALVAQLVPFHRNAAVAAADSRFGQPGQVRAPMLDNLSLLDERLTATADRAALARLRQWEADEGARLQPVFAGRLRDGRIRECHGDLHLGNVVEIDGRTTVFDGIDFNPGLRWIDVLSDLAFMAMDLHAHARAGLAHRLVNSYLEASGDYAGARVLRYYMVYRALVRAKVAALRSAQPAAPPGDEAARRYLRLATALIQPAAPALMITHGPSGSGKTSLTQGLLEAAGALRIRADVERKRLFGLDAAARSGSPVGAGLYTPEASAATYARLLELAAVVLDGGFSVILDATFLRRAQRDAARQAAAVSGLRFIVLDFGTGADAQALRQRVRERADLGHDASEADVAVLDAQLQATEPLAPDEQAFAWRSPPALMDTDRRLHADWSVLLASLGPAV